jgi:DNA-binding transcriptional ArsR family regulator
MKMAEKRIDLVLHPVRMRILITLVDREMTAKELSRALPDVAQATLYRHLNALADAGLVQVAAERQVHSVMEKIYTSAQGAAVLSPEDVAGLTPEEHFRHFTVFATTLISMFERYLEQSAPVDMVADMAGYRQVPLYLSDQELIDVVQGINRALVPHLANDPTPERRRRLFTTVLFPLEEPAGSSSG